MNKNPKERTEFIGIRVTPEEKELLKSLAQATGVSLTAFLIGRALGDKLGDVYLNALDRKNNPNS